jgi:hypothetical protein
MDQHYYLVTHNPSCPLDGSRAAAAEQVVSALPHVAEPLNLTALAEAGVTPEALADTIVVELPDGEPPPGLLRPWFEGEHEAR